MKTVSSDYIIKMLDHWTVRKKLTIVLELCDGSLKDKRMGYTQAIQTFKQIVEGVKCLHEKNIIHRDIKLENILMKGDVVKISDFGLAKKMGSKEWVQSIKCGTPCTMAPEVFFNSNCYNHKPTYNSKCDIWSLGVVLHELVYKCHPFNYDMERFRNCRRVNVKKPVH
jgi:serine/threonine protein kinase